jgi:hypothetical protein
MKASAIVTALQALIAVHGDLEVILLDPDTDELLTVDVEPMAQMTTFDGEAVPAHFRLTSDYSGAHDWPPPSVGRWVDG